MANGLLIGYGNPLRGDDAIGQVVAQRFAEGYAMPGVEVRALYQLVPELAEELSHFERVVFVDASVTLPPGEIACESLYLASMSISESFTHRVTPQGLLEMSRELYGKAPRAWIISVGGENFEHREGISLKLAERVDVICRKIVTLFLSA